MRHAVAAMAAQGNSLVVDDVMTQEGQDRALLSAFDARLVGLFAPLDVLEARERRRRLRPDAGRRHGQPIGDRLPHPRRIRPLSGGPRPRSSSQPGAPTPKR